MWGQWIGTIDGKENKGEVTLSIDRDSPWQGKILVVDSKPGLSHIWHVHLEPDKKDKSRITGELFSPISFDYSFILNPEIKYENIIMPGKGNMRGVLEGDRFKGTWETDIGTEGVFNLERFENNEPVEADAILDWETFYKYVQQFSGPDKAIFRGVQNNTHKLITSLHRTGRRDLFRYNFEDVPRLNRYISCVSGKVFYLHHSDDYGGLLNLVQHHGYPTPLLDWTESPYVAAYFAFRKPRKIIEQPRNKSRIYAFKHEAWIRDGNQYTPVYMTDPRFQFSILELSMRDNNRAIPQQSVQSFSNIYDIEGLIKQHEMINGSKYLYRIDIEHRYRNQIMNNLNLMNINGGSLFPGIDGTCEMLKEKYY